MENKKPLEILVVEDGEKNIKVAQQVFDTRRDIKVTYRDNLKDVEGRLERYEGVISDLMFPYDKKGSLESHKKLVSRIVDTLYEELMGLDSDMDGIPKKEILYRDLDELENSLLDGTMIFGKSAAFGQYRRDFHKNPHSDFDEMDRKKSETIPAEQPMGVLVAEECKQKGTPYVIVTSGHGAHGDITTPIATYMMLKGLIKHYRGQNDSTRETLQKKFAGRIPSLEEYAAAHNKFITDADKTEKEVWEHALKIIKAQIDGIII